MPSFIGGYLPQKGLLKSMKTSSIARAETPGLSPAKIPYQRIFETTRDGILLLDAETEKIIDANPAVMKLLGYSRAEFLGKELWEIGLLADESANRAMFRELQEKGEARYENLPLQNKGGERREVEFVSAIFQETGGMTSIIQCNIRDITERKEAQEALRRSEERVTGILESMTDGVQVFDAGFRFTYLNGASRRMLTAQGVDPASLIGKRVWDEVFPDERDSPSTQQLRRVMTERVVLESENYYEPWKRWYSWRAYPTEDGGISIFYRDITEHKRAEETLIRLEHLFTHAGWPVVATDAVDNRLILVNPACARMHGYTVEELLGQPLATLLAPESRVDLPEHILRANERGEYLYESLHRRKDGTTFPVLTHVSVLKDDQGRVLYRAATFKDITERKRIEQGLVEARTELEHYAISLEKKVDERTAHLQEIIGEMEAVSYSLSHDMRAPLRAMRGFSQILMKEFAGKLGPEGQDYLTRISNSAKRLDQLIQDVLTYSRVGSSSAFHAVDLEKLIHEIIVAHPELEPAQAEITLVTPLLPVWGHEASLSQCLSNLLVNAAKFVAPGVRPQVRVWTEATGEGVRLWVQDNGIGIAPDHQKRIFDIFTRLNLTTEYEGTGIGLAIVRKAVERMGGKVGVESERGKGSRFWLQLKRVE
jgi:PAS domain S-box-containing protein